MQGASEAIAVKEVLSLYGVGFRSRIYEWFHLARALSQDKRDIVKKHRDFNQSWIFGNKFLLGEGVDQKFVMSAASFEAAVDLVPWVANHRSFFLSTLIKYSPH